MTRGRVLRVAFAIVFAAGLAVYSFDPPWVPALTSGLGDWERDAGIRFRWTTGHATFYVPRDAALMVVPLRAESPGPLGAPVIVRLTVDDRFLGEIALADPRAWQSILLPLPARPTLRRSRRIDLRVSRTVGPSNVGVQVGEIRLETR